VNHVSSFIKDEAMQRNVSLLNLFLGLMIILLVGSACNPRINITSSPQVEQIVTETSKFQLTNTPTLPPSQTVTPIIRTTKTATRTLAKTLPPSQTVAPTIRPTKTATWTPALTLPPDQALAQMQKWLQGDANCLFPCWAGITPNVTTWQEAKFRLSSVVKVVDTAENTKCIYGPCNYIEWRSRDDIDVHGYIGSQADGSIYGIIVNVSKPMSIYRLNQLLSEYGPPKKVFISTSSFLQSPNELFLSFTMAYPNHQFIITYIWKAVQSGENVVSCFQDGEGVSLSIKPIEGEWTDDLIKNEVYGYTDINAIVFRPLEEVTDFDVDGFYNTFKNGKGGGCIITPIEYWP
jgi:hypothetical protein